MKEVVRRAHVLLRLLVFLTLAASVYIVLGLRKQACDCCMLTS